MDDYQRDLFEDLTYQARMAEEVAEQYCLCLQQGKHDQKSIDELSDALDRISKRVNQIKVEFID